MVKMGQIYTHTKSSKPYMVLGVGSHATNTEESNKRYVYYMNEQGELFDREITEFTGYDEECMGPRFTLGSIKWKGKVVLLGTI